MNWIFGLTWIICVRLNSRTVREFVKILSYPSKESADVFLRVNDENEPHSRSQTIVFLIERPDILRSDTLHRVREAPDVKCEGVPIAQQSLIQFEVVGFCSLPG